MNETTALLAIIARIKAERNNRSLSELGPLSTNTTDDVLAIATAALHEPPTDATQKKCATLKYLVPVYVNIFDGRIGSIHVDDEAGLHDPELCDPSDYTLEEAQKIVDDCEDFPAWEFGF